MQCGTAASRCVLRSAYSTLNGRKWGCPPADGLVLGPLAWAQGWEKDHWVLLTFIVRTQGSFVLPVTCDFMMQLASKAAMAQVWPETGSQAPAENSRSPWERRGKHCGPWTQSWKMGCGVTRLSLCPWPTVRARVKAEPLCSPTYCLLSICPSSFRPV